VAVFVACWLGFFPLIFVMGYELLFCQQLQKSNQKKAAPTKHPTGSLRFSKITGKKELATLKQPSF